MSKIYFENKGYAIIENGRVTGCLSSSDVNLLPEGTYNFYFENGIEYFEGHLKGYTAPKRNPEPKSIDFCSYCSNIKRCITCNWKTCRPRIRWWEVYRNHTGTN